MKFLNNKFYVLFICIFILPLNGFLIAEVSPILGVMLIITQIPHLYNRLKD